MFFIGTGFFVQLDLCPAIRIFNLIKARKYPRIRVASWISWARRIRNHGILEREETKKAILRARRDKFQNKQANSLQIGKFWNNYNLFFGHNVNLMDKNCFPLSWINSKEIGNHEIATQKWWRNLTTVLKDFSGVFNLLNKF